MIETQKSKYYDLSIITLDRNDINKTQMNYVKTIAGAVLLKPNGRQTFLHHMQDKTIMLHITPDEAEFLRKTPEQGGPVVLDDRGVIPGKYINKSTIALYYEYDNIQDLLDNNQFDEHDYGRLVLVRDPVDDTRLGEHPQFSWVIYRLIDPENTHSVDSYQPIIRKWDMDVVIDWDDIEKDLQSTVQQIDQMVHDAHKHVCNGESNKAVLESFMESSTGDLLYKGKRVIMRSEFQAVITKRNTDYANVFDQDVVLQITKDKEKDPDIDPSMIVHNEPFTVLDGNKDYYYKDNLEIQEVSRMRTSGVTSMKGFFQGCSNLIRFDPLDTKNVTDLESFMEGCTCMTFPYYINMKSAVTIKNFAKSSGLRIYGDVFAPVAIDASYAFADTPRLKEIGIIKLPKATDVSCFFHNASELKELKYNVYLPAALNCESMFDGCTKLTSIDRLETPMMQDARYMFQDNWELVSIGYIDCTSLVNANHMFIDCPKLEFVNIKPGSLHCDICFANTNIGAPGLKVIIKALRSSNHTLDIRETPAASLITEDDIAAIHAKGWTVVYE
jgi:hypothetical protein